MSLTCSVLSESLSVGVRQNGSVWQNMQMCFPRFIVYLLRVIHTADHFKEICPAGHGYTYSLSDVQISVRHLGEDDVQSTGVSWEEQSHLYPQIPSSYPSLPFGPQHPSHPQTPQIPHYSETVPRDPLTPQQPLHPVHPAGGSLERPEGENEIWHDGKSLPGNVYP